MLFLLFGMLSWSGEDTPDMEIEVNASLDKDIYIAPPVVKQDGKEVSDYDYAPIVFSKMVMYKKTANYYYDAKIGDIYNDITIITLDQHCNYKEKPILCSYENSHWVLKTDIQITRDKAYISMTLFDDAGQPASSATVSKKLRRKIIPRRRSEQRSDTSISPGGVNASRQKKSEDDPLILNFPAIIDEGDVGQAVQLLYGSLR